MVGLFVPGLYVCQCYRCGKWQSNNIKSTKFVFSCRSCKATRKINQSTVFGLSIKMKGPYEGTVVSRVVSELNAQDKEAGFYTYGGTQ